MSSMKSLGSIQSPKLSKSLASVKKIVKESQEEGRKLKVSIEEMVAEKLAEMDRFEASLQSKQRELEQI